MEVMRLIAAPSAGTISSPAIKRAFQPVGNVTGRVTARMARMRVHSARIVLADRTCSSARAPVAAFPKKWVCDGEKDCPSGLGDEGSEDEGPQCGGVAHIPDCPPPAHLCTSGKLAVLFIS